MRAEIESCRIRPPRDFKSTNFVFSSVLRELTRQGTALLARHELSSAATACPVSVFARSRRWRCPLRTAEQARASLFIPSYKEPTVDALAPRTDEGRE
jgi:hypothetical protein